MSLHQEHHFESEICTQLAARGWLYEEGDAAKFDRASGFFLPDLLAWVEASRRRARISFSRARTARWSGFRSRIGI